MVNPLYIYVGLAAASLGGLVAVSHERWEHWPNSAEQVVGKVETAAPAQPPEPATPIVAAPAPSAPVPSAAAPASSVPAGVSEAKPAAPPEPDAAPGAQPPSAGKTDITQELAALGQPEVKSPRPGAAGAIEKPAFDIVRVDPEGQAVVAGRSEPGWQVDVKINGETKGKTVANERGEWVWVTQDPIGPGSSEITLEARREPAAPPLNSDQSVGVVVSGTPGKQALVVLSQAARPTKVMQSPDEQEPVGTPQVALAPPGDTPPAAAAKPAPVAPKRSVTLDVVDYDDAGEIIFSGRGSPGATVRLYVDNDPVGDAPIDRQGAWTLSGKGRITPGQHALRVDELAAGAKVQSRIELPFVRAKPAEVAALDRNGTAPAAAPPAQSTQQPAQPMQPTPPAGAASPAPVPTSPPATVESEPEATPKSDKLAAAIQPSGSAASPSVAAAPPMTLPPATVAPAAPSASAAAPSASTPPATPAISTPPAMPSISTPPATANQPVAEAPTPSAADQQPMGKGEAMAGLPEAAPGNAEARPRHGRVVIQPGNNLWNISRVIYGKGTRYTVIYQANKELIRNPRFIYPGQIFATPGSVQPDAIDPKWRKPLAEMTSDGATPN